MIVIVDYGMGNLRSILYKLQNLKVEAVISSNEQEINAADKLILPGVGHFAKGMSNLHERGIIPILNKKVIEDNTPILGICLGMQLFTNGSEEGDVKGLGWIDADTKRFKFNESSSSFRIPHVGWNLLNVKKKTPLLEGIGENKRFYFTHSFHVNCYDENNVIATTDYGYAFTCIVQKGNISGTQFHPEKSHQTGMKVISNFIGSN